MGFVIEYQDVVFHDCTSEDREYTDFSSHRNLLLLCIDRGRTHPRLCEMIVL